MACKEEKRIIGSNEYYCRQWPAEKSLLMKFRLGKLFGPAFMGLMTEITKEGEQDLTWIVEKLFESNQPETILAFMKEVVETATCNGKRINAVTFNDLYTDNLLEFYQVFFFILELNYKSFLAGKLPGILERLKAQAPGVMPDK